MRRIIKVALATLLLATVYSGTVASAAATNLPAGMLIGDQDGIHVSADGDYFICAEALEAGDVITKRLTIHNTEPYTFKLSMTAEPLEETGPLQLLDELRCTLRMDGKVLYDGRIRGNDGIDMIRNALDLGTYQSGGQKTLDITLTVNPDMQQHHWAASEAYFKWNFYAVQNVKEEGPITGEVIKNSLYFILPGLMLAMGVLVLIKRRREESAVRLIAS